MDKIRYLVPLVRGLFIQLINLKFGFILLAERGVKVHFGSNFTCTGIIYLKRFSELDLRYTDEVIIKDRFVLGPFSIARSSGSRDFVCPQFVIGERVSFGPYSYIGGGFGLQIGDDVMTGGSVSIHPETHGTEPGFPYKEQPIKGSGIKIGSNIWIGQKSTILDGVTVGNNVIVGANSVITNDCVSSSIYAGVPARLIRNV